MQPKQRDKGCVYFTEFGAALNQLAGKSRNHLKNRERLEKIDRSFAGSKGLTKSRTIIMGYDSQISFTLDTICPW
jgi:hypothetical protein